MDNEITSGLSRIFTAARGMARTRIDPLLDRIQADESVPVLARELFAAQAEEYAQV